MLIQFCSPYMASLAWWINGIVMTINKISIMTTSVLKILSKGVLYELTDEKYCKTSVNWLHNVYTQAMTEGTKEWNIMKFSVYTRLQHNYRHKMDLVFVYIMAEIYVQVVVWIQYSWTTNIRTRKSIGLEDSLSMLFIGIVTTWYNITRGTTLRVSTFTTYMW